MLRTMLGLLVLTGLSVMSSVEAKASVYSQTIKCENKSQGLVFNVKLDNFTEDGKQADVLMDVNMKKGSGFQGKLVREEIAPASNPGAYAIRGEGSAKNFTLEIVLDKSQLRKSFKNVSVAAFLDNPLSDQGFYPHRVPVKCNSQIN